MDYLTQAVSKAFWLIVHFDSELAIIVWTSLKVSLTSTALASVVGVPLGFMLAIAPAMRIGESTFGRLTPSAIPRILKTYTDSYGNGHEEEVAA